VLYVNNTDFSDPITKMHSGSNTKGVSRMPIPCVARGGAEIVEKSYRNHGRCQGKDAVKPVVSNLAGCGTPERRVSKPGLANKEFVGGIRATRNLNDGEPERVN